MNRKDQNSEHCSNHSDNKENFNRQAINTVPAQSNE